MVSLDRRRVLTATGWVLAAGLGWRVTVAVFWVADHVFLLSSQARTSRIHDGVGAPHLVTDYLIGFLPTNVRGLENLLAGGLAGGVVLGVLAGTAWRAVIAFIVAVGSDVALAQMTGPWTPAVDWREGTAQTVAAVFSGLLVVVSACGAAVGLLARRHPAGVSGLFFLSAAVVPVLMILVSDAANRSRGDTSLGLPCFVQSALIAAAVAVAVRALSPRLATVTVMSGLIWYFVVQDLLVGAGSAPDEVVQGIDNRTARFWHYLFNNGLSNARIWLTIHWEVFGDLRASTHDRHLLHYLLGYYRNLGLAIAIGILTGLLARAQLRRQKTNPSTTPAN